MSFALAVVSILLQQPTDGARVALAPAPRLYWESPGLFDAYLPGCRRLYRSPERLTAVADDAQYEIVDLTKATACSTGWLGKGARVQDVAAWRGGLVRLIVDREGKLQVEAEQRGCWREIAGPQKGFELRCDPAHISPLSYPLLAADGDRIVVLAGTTLHQFENDKWTSRVVLLSDGESNPPGSRLLLDGATLYVGTDMGEWGGALYSVDLETGDLAQISRRWPDGDSNVADIDRGPDGRIWATTGCAHMDGHGELYEQIGSTWRLVAKTDWIAGLRDRECSEWLSLVNASNQPGQLPWIFPPTGFVALDFDREGRPCLLTETFGLFRLEEGGRWKWLTPGWPVWEALATDLVIVDNRAVISSRLAGVVVVDLDTLAAQRVRIQD